MDAQIEQLGQILMVTLSISILVVTAILIYIFWLWLRVHRHAKRLLGKPEVLCDGEGRPLKC